MSPRKSTARETAQARPAAAPARGLFTGWAAAILGLLVVLFFHEVALEGRTFVSPDATQPLGFVRVGEQSLWKDRVYPLWNPYVFLGMPSFGSGAYNPLIYPPDWPLALIARVIPLPDMTWMLLYYFVGALFTFLLAREWGARPEGALLAGAAFVFAPNLVAVGSHGHGSQLVNSAYLPLMLWLAARWLRGRGIHYLGLLALAGGFQMLRGHVQIAFYTWLAVGLYAIAEWIGGLRRAGELPRLTARAAGVAVAAALAFGIAGFFNLPLRDYARHSIRGGGPDGGVGMDYATQWSLSPVELPSVVVPGWAGFGGQLYWGGMPFTDYPNAFVGIVTVALAVLAFAAPGVRRTPRLFALGLAVLALLISFGRNFPLYGFLYEHFPLFNKFRIPVMIVLLFQLAAALGLAWGWSAALAAPAKRGAPRDAVDRAILAAAIAIAAAFALFVLGAGAWAEGYARLAAATHPGYPPEAARLAYSGWTGDLARACGIGLAALGAAWLARRGRLTPALGSIVVLVLLLFELWPVSGRVMKPTIGDVAVRDLDAGRDDVVRFLEQAGPDGSFRILPLAPGEFQNNRYAGFRIASLGGYHAAKPRLFQDFFERDMPNQPLWLRLLNVRYLVSPQPLEPVPPFLREVFRGSAIVYEMPLALPRVTVLGRYRVVTPPAAILDSVAAGTTDAAVATFLTEDPGLALGPVEGASARITRYGLNDLAIEVDTPGPALVRVADAWYPDWKATVDGRPAEVLRADYLLRAVAVPAGRHVIEMRFASAAVGRGLWLSIASVAAALLLILLGVRRARRRPAPPAAAAEAA